MLEQELNSMSYNIEEITYDNLKQLIWRWWRKWEKKEIILQTFVINNDFVKMISEWNYKDFLKNTMFERKIFLYPPFWELVNIEYYDRNAQKSLEFLQTIKPKLESYNTDDKVEFFLNKKWYKRTGFYHKDMFISKLPSS